MIKLLDIGTIDSIGENKVNVIRLQSQLMVGSDTADFILEDGVLKVYSYGDKGFNFYPYDLPYKIVTDKKEMLYQAI